MTEYVLGIDGGGTHTRMELRTAENDFVRRKTFGPFNMASIGEAAFRLRLQEVFAEAGVMGQVRSVCVGGAGVSGSAMEAVLRQELEQSGFRGTLTLCGDHEIALRAAMDGPGCVLIAGTGSICYGRNADGTFARCGGWGHLLDDCGSAYALGREALTAALRTMDGRLPENTLHRAVMAHLHADNPREIVAYAYYSNAGKEKIAALAPVVIQCAESGDPISRKILEAAADELCGMAAAVMQQLGLTSRLALMGGLLEHDSIYRAMLCRKLPDCVSIVKPEHDALWAAAQTAYERQ